MNILLSYVSYPVTTAVYFDRALRQNHNVITVGPHLAESMVKEWNLENMKLPIEPQDFPTNTNPDMQQIVEEISQKNRLDLYLYIESVRGYYPRNVQNIKIPKACYLIDTHLHLEEHIALGKQFDHVFIAQSEYVPEFKKHGINIHWLPLGCDPEIHDNFADDKKHDIGFVGSVNHDRRQELIDKLKVNFDFYFERCFWKDMSKVLSESKVVFNNAVRQDLNMRIFETLSIGSFLLTDKTKKSSQDELFVSGEDYYTYDDETIEQSTQFFLENNELRELIAQRGFEIARNAHKYIDRCNDMLEVIKGNKSDTFSAKEIREKSLENVNISTDKINKAKRSFVIPVIDYSPASKFNIKTLLRDLESIEGNVIIIFNSEKVANEISDYPRIDYYAIMNKNIGVAPAWNLGMNISRTPITYILNSDLHIRKETVDKMDDALINVPDAAVVGPQGSFFHYEKLKDIHYFDKGSFESIIEVDAVSGFLFAVKTKYFTEGTLNFENRFAPCYFEEWDLGLKVKMNNLRSYVVPTTAYEHEWSGSIRSMKTVKFFDKEETLRGILDRNTISFHEIWNKRLAESDPQLKESLWLQYAMNNGEKALEIGEIKTAEKIFKNIIDLYPNNKFAYVNLAIANFSLSNKGNAISNLKKALEIDPNFLIAQQNLEAII